MSTQFEIRREKKVIHTGNFEDVMRRWNLLIGQAMPATREEKRFADSHRSSNLLLIPSTPETIGQIQS